MTYRVLFIDNYDSFTYNLVDEFAKRKADVVVFRNDVGMDVLDREIESGVDLVVISPGPGAPANAGLCPAFLKEYSGKVPIFGVCLGLQCIVEYLGGEIRRAPEVVHGKSSLLEHNGEGIFAGLDNPLRVGRYHSLVAYDVPDCMEATARAQGLVMAARHREIALSGVQFHPESVLTPAGGRMLENLMKQGRTA
jgi:anthranilate synthase component II